MRNSLYFIPLISKALTHKSPAESLEKAFKTITMLGEKPEYRQGYDQFLKFMAIALKTPRNELMHLTSIWRDLLSLDIEGESTKRRPKPVELCILKNNEPIASIPILSDETSLNIANVSPGFYTIQLSTGRLLWEGRLSKEDLLWTYAYFESDIQMAADTEDGATDPIKVIELLEGDIIIRVFPGFESGIIQVDVK